MCRSLHFIGVLYLEGLRIDAGASREQVFHKITSEFQNRFQKNPDKRAQIKSILKVCRIVEPVYGGKNEGLYKLGRYHGETMKDVESIDFAWIRSPKKIDGDIEFTGKLALLLEVVNENDKCSCGACGSLVCAVPCGAIAHC